MNLLYHLSAKKRN